MSGNLEKKTAKIVSQLLRNLEKVLEADVFTFYGPIVNGIEGTVKEIIEALHKHKDKHDSIYVILTTTGGSLPPVQRIVDILHHFYTEVNFIIPDYAFSAGTILCMSGDNIYMNYYSCLGPVDPQVQNKEGKLVAALGYLDKIEELLEKAKNGTLTQAEFLILRDFDLAELRSYEQAKELAIDMLQTWLVKYKFKTWEHHSNGDPVEPQEKEDRAYKIAEMLSDNKRWKTHNRPIGIHVLRDDLKLQILDYEEDSKKKEAINEYYDLISEYIKSHNYGNFFHTRLFI